MEKIHVKIGGSGYSIYARNGGVEGHLIHEFFEEQMGARRSSQYVAIVDEYFSNMITFPTNWRIVYVEGSEESKSRETKAFIEDSLMEYNCDKDAVLVAIGGGTIGDLTGFVASTYMRGIRYIQIPTTLLAMVDSSVGGKTAVNLKHAKNVIGSFHQPSLVLVDISFLSSLSNREIANGVAEIVKAGFVGDETLWNMLSEIPDVSSFRSSPEKLLKIVCQSILYKKRVVEQDEKDEGIRNVLNFGHTIGHALELIEGGTKHLHGECVAMGMVYELLALRAVGFLESKTCISELCRILSKFDLPTIIPRDLKFDLKIFKSLVLKDKKNRGSENTVSIVGVKGMRNIVKDSPNRIVEIPLRIVVRVVAPFVSVSRRDPSQAKIFGNVNVPGSKSVANRALLLAALAGVACELSNVPQDSKDVGIMIAALQALGSPLTVREDYVKVNGPITREKEVSEITIYVGNSGTTARFLLPVCAWLVEAADDIKEIKFTSSQRMKQRPVSDLLDCVEQLFSGIEIISQQRSFPLILRKRMESEPIDEIEVNGEMSSQFVSAILMMGPLYPKPLSVKIKGGESVSTPFIEMTLRMINIFGGNVKENCKSFETFPEKYTGVSSFKVPGDAAAASYPLAIASISGGTISVNIDSDDGLQSGDFQFVKTFLQDRMGCSVAYGRDSTTVSGNGMMGEEQFFCDFSNMTDTFLTASMLMGRTGGTINGIDNQRVKECDRITAVALNMNKCGFIVSEDGNSLRFSPSPSESHGGPCVISTFNDHRVAMAFAVLSCAADENRVKTIFIENPRCVEKTYPGFWDMLEADLGLEVTGHDHVPGGTKLQFASAIVGMRGIGKSTLGKVTAETLGYMFVDLDKCIEVKFSSSVEAIIETCGWEKFREIEAQVLKTEVYVAEREQRLTIIATGGGVVESAESREILSMLKTVVWLKSQDDETTINAAIEASQSAPQYSETVEAVYRRRKPLYAAISAFDVYRGDFALSQMIRILSPTMSHHNTPREGSTFVCLTARDYTDWSARDFQQSMGYSSSVEAVEIRVDKILNLEFFLNDFARIRSLCKKPVILTLRSVAEGGDFAGTDYQATIQKLLRVCPDWIDVEVEKKVLLDYEVFHGTKFIASRHFPLERPKNLRRAIESVVPDWADMGKIVLPDDFISLAFLARQVSLERAKPIITLISGASGIPSRILNRCLTPCAAEDAAKRCPPAAVGQLKPHQLDLVRNKIFEHQPTFTFHLFGDPIDKSPSPYLHNLMFALKGLVGRKSCVYSPVPCSDLETVRTCISCPFFRGASVTTPLKESVYAYLASIGAELSEAAQSAQSVNTISVTSCGGLKGDNTDIIALEKVLTESGCRRTSCLVMGTGGAGRGALYAAKKSGFKSVFLLGRNSEKVKSICIETASVPFNPSLAYDVVIGCIPPGVQSEVDLLPHIRAGSLVVDMAYIPRETVLIQTLGKNAEKVIYGSQILLLQAIAQHQIWLSSLLGRGEALRTDLTGVEITPNLLSSFLDKFRV